jgi:hypothetical protein
LLFDAITMNSSSAHYLLKSTFFWAITNTRIERLQEIRME